MDKKTWLITGVAGFIGSNLLQRLLELDQRVYGIDNLSTGFEHNLTEVGLAVGDKWKNFSWAAEPCESALNVFNIKVDYVVHLAALGSVPRSLKNPLKSHTNNFDSFMAAIDYARLKEVKSFVFASSSSVHGNNGKLTSPYALTKHINELVAEDYNKHYGLKITGLRFFNVFGPRQNPAGEYAAVIPKWTNALFRKEEIQVNGDGEIRRDFTYVDNVVDAIIKASVHTDVDKLNQKNYICADIGCGTQTSLNRLLYLLLDEIGPRYKDAKIKYVGERKGDIKQSLADINPAQRAFGYTPEIQVREGLRKYISWFEKMASQSQPLRSQVG